MPFHLASNIVYLKHYFDHLNPYQFAIQINKIKSVMGPNLKQNNNNKGYSPVPQSVKLYITGLVFSRYNKYTTKEH